MESGLAQSSPLFESEDVGQIAADSLPAFESAIDGTFHSAFRVRMADQEALRVRFENVRLPAGSALLVYGSDALRPWTYRPGANAVATVPGAIATIEVQCGEECPSTLPFDITAVEAAHLSELEVESAPLVGADIREGTYNGVPIRYEVRDGLAIFEGDIILGTAEELDSEGASDKHNPKEAVGMTSTLTRWPGGVVPYALSATAPNPLRIAAAVEHWNTMLKGVIRLIPRTSESKYVQFTSGTGCASGIGMSRFGLTYIQLSAACSTGNIIHEIGHAVGLHHEQSRNDRDNHVSVLNQNIVVSGLWNFDKVGTSGTSIGGYDYGSIMHYGAYNFSANGHPTIVTKPAGIPIGQRAALSAGDIAGVRIMYGYSAMAATTTTNTTTATSTSYDSVTVTANPQTEAIVVDGVTFIGSRTFTWASGSAHTISAPDRPLRNGSTATFANWTNAGAQTQTITANPNVPQYKANFALRYSVSTVASSSTGGYVSAGGLGTDGLAAANSNVSLLASPNAGYCFGGWTGLIAGTPARTFVSVTGPLALTANFIPGSISPATTRLEVGRVGGTYSLGVAANSGCVWTASSDRSWVSLATPTTRTGSSVLTVTVAANAGSFSRSATITVGSSRVTITQPGE
jgi:astacin